MFTRKVDKNDGLAGFTYNWVKKFAGNVDHLDVICLEKGEIAGLPENAAVHSLGKEKGKNRWLEFWRLQKLAFSLVPKVDGVFTHQNPEYGIMLAPWARLFKKPIIAWYAHGAVNFKVALLNALVDKIVTSTSQGFRLSSKKAVVLHQGIDTDVFAYREKEIHKGLRLLTVGRISASKNIHLMIDLVADLRRQGKEVILKIAGAPSLVVGNKYLADLRAQVDNLGLQDAVIFLGSIVNCETPALYQWADIFLNFSVTGSLDKTILEAMSCGTLVLTSNDSGRVILQNVAPELILSSPQAARGKVMRLEEIDRKALGLALRQYVVNNHRLDQLVKKIVRLFD
ncbi:MAG: glycosyltransferase family 4 protein [Patescibacteria group bacterium]